MKVELCKTFQFEAAHRLPFAPKDHKCRNIHGHSYTVEVYVRGEVDPKVGWFIDYGDIAKAFEPIRQQLDHKILNEIEGLEHGTAEMLAKWIYDRLKPVLPGLTKIVVRETQTSSCTYRGEE